MGKKHYTFAQQACIKKAGLVMQRTGALWPDCRVGIALSGGVDSFTLLKVLRIRQGIVPFKFELMVLHCNPGFNIQSHAGALSWLAEEGVAAHVEVTDFGLRSHSPENRKASPCFYCAWLRRKRLFELCQRYNLTHLALGHNAEDLGSTFMLNLFRNGRVQGMSMNESFFGGKLHLIRPLLLVEKKYILQAARQWHLPVWRNDCPSAGKTARAHMEGVLAKIGQDVPDARRSLLNGVGRWQLGMNEDKKQTPAAIR